MNTFLKSITILMLLAGALFLTGCSSSSYRVSGSAGYGVYHGYNYSSYNRYNSYYDRNVNVRVDPGRVHNRNEHRVENRPVHHQNVQAARSRASSMGRPARSGGGGRRR